MDYKKGEAVKYKIVFKMAKFLKNHIGDILTIAGIVGTAASVATAANAGIEAAEEVYLERDPNSDPLEKLDILKMKWKKFVLPMALTGGTIAIEILARNHFSNVIVGLAGGLALSAQRNREMRESVEAVYGEDGLKQINTETMCRTMTKRMNEGTVALPENNGLTHIYEPFSGQDFWATESQMLMIKLKANEMLAEEWEIPFGDFIDLISQITGCDMERSAGDRTYGWYACEDIWREWWDHNFNGKVWLDWDLIPAYVEGIGEMQTMCYNLDPDVPSMGLDGFDVVIPVKED